MTEEIFCTVCDGDIGIHKKNGICTDICDSWYLECKLDFMEVIPENERVPGSGVWLDFFTDFDGVQDGQKIYSLYEY